MPRLPKGRFELVFMSPGTSSDISRKQLFMQSLGKFSNFILKCHQNRLDLKKAHSTYHHFIQARKDIPISSLFAS